MDHSVNAAARLIENEEAAATRACQEAAYAHGITPEQAEECEDGQHSCATCPWAKSAGAWRPGQGVFHVTYGVRTAGAGSRIRWKETPGTFTEEEAHARAKALMEAGPCAEYPNRHGFFVVDREDMFADKRERILHGEPPRDCSPDSDADQIPF